MKSTPVYDLVQAYEGSLRRRGYAASSRHRNGHYLRDFAQWAGDRERGEIPASQIELGFIAEWCDQFEQRNGRATKPRTVRNMIGQLRCSMPSRTSSTCWWKPMGDRLATR